MKEQELREQVKNKLSMLLEALPMTGIKEDVPVGRGKRSSVVDMVAEVKMGPRARKLVFEFKQRGYPLELERGISFLEAIKADSPDIIPVLVAPFLSESSRRLLRSHGVNYLDLSGNSFIAFDNVLIYKEAPGNTQTIKKEGINIFADKASLIIRELMANPDKHYTVRELSKATLNSVGWTSEVLREIEDRGYLDRRHRQGCRLRRIQYLLSDWTDEYVFPGKSRMKNYFIKAESLEETLGSLRRLEMPAEVDYALTLHGGARLVAPFVQVNECHLYVSAHKDFERQADFFARELNLMERDEGGNLHILKPYYREGALYGSRRIEGLRVVSDLQLYLDLYRFPVRGGEQAQKVLEKSGFPDTRGWA